MNNNHESTGVAKGSKKSQRKKYNYTDIEVLEVLVVNVIIAGILKLEIAIKTSSCFITRAVLAAVALIHIKVKMTCILSATKTGLFHTKQAVALVVLSQELTELFAKG